MNSTLSDIRSSMTSLVDQHRVKIVININNFLNSIKERVNNHNEDIFDAIIKQYTSIKARNHETDKEKKITSKVIYAKTLSHLHQLRLYEK